MPVVQGEGAFCIYLGGAKEAWKSMPAPSVIPAVRIPMKLLGPEYWTFRTAAQHEKQNRGARRTNARRLTSFDKSTTECVLASARKGAGSSLESCAGPRFRGVVQRIQ